MQRTPEQEEHRTKVDKIVERLKYNLDHSNGFSKTLLLKTLVEKLQPNDIDSLVFAIDMTPLPEEGDKHDTK